MIYRRLDKNWDYTFGHGKADYLSEKEAVAQAIKTRLYLLYKEWWEDLEDGLPLFERILGASGSKENVEAIDIIYRDRIEKTKGVLAVTKYESEFNAHTRAYSFLCTVETLYGMLSVTNAEVMRI